MKLVKIKASPYKFIGPCDRVRNKSEENEQFWHEMMKNKKKISMKKFAGLADTEAMLDEGETLKDYVNDNTDVEFYSSNWGKKKAVFLQTSGFEFIFVK